MNGMKMKETYKIFQVEKKAQSVSGSSPQGGGPKTAQVRVHLGVQEQPAPKMKARSHTESVFNVLYMDGKIISRNFQYLQIQAQNHLESMGIIKTSGHPEYLSRCCDTIFWAVGPCIVLGSIMDVARGLCMPQPSYN